MTRAQEAPAWLSALRGNPLPWLLEEESPAVRHLALRRLRDRTGDDPDVRRACDAAMKAEPIAAVLAAQAPEGYWVKPGPGYSPKYRATVWQVIFLDQLGADGGDPRVQAACEYVLSHTQAESGGFAASGRKSESRPPGVARAPLSERKPAAGASGLRVPGRRARAARDRLAGEVDHG